MKLNPDCIRDILFVIEEHSTYSNDVSEDKLYKNLFQNILKSSTMFDNVNIVVYFSKFNTISAVSQFKIYLLTVISSLMIFAKITIGIEQKIQQRMSALFHWMSLKIFHHKLLPTSFQINLTINFKQTVAWLLSAVLLF